MTVSSSVSAKRTRVQSRTRSSAAPSPGLFLLKPSIATYTIRDLIPQQVTPRRRWPGRRGIGERSDAVLWTAMPGHDEGKEPKWLKKYWRRRGAGRART